MSGPSWSAPNWSTPADLGNPVAWSDAGLGGQGGSGQRVSGGVRYTVGPTLGSGGMGRVLLGHDPVLQRELAVKEALTPAAAGRLCREARLLARLDHPSIVAIYDADLQVPWFAMRLVRGATLSEAIARSADLDARLRLLRHLLSACEGVAHAHAAGIVHRDLKPDNILVSDLGETQVLDWGLAADLAERPADATDNSAESEPLDGQMTTAGSVLGTPRYLSPEAARGEPLDRRADVWSLGVLLWQTLVGANPWGNCQVPEMLARLRRGESPVPQDDEQALALAGPGLPLELLAVARWATAADPNQRYADARAMAADLEAWLDGRHVSAHRYTRGQLFWRAVKTLRLPLTVGAVALVVVAAVLAVATQRVVQERDTAQTALIASQRAQAGLSAAQALAAVEAGRGPEAEQAAAQALHGAVGQADAAVARGVVAQLAAGPRVALLQARTLPGCREAVVAEDGREVLCRGDGGLALWPAGADAPRWKVALGLQNAVLPPLDATESADRLVVQTGNDLVQVLRRSDGQPVGSAVPAGGPKPLRLARGVAAQSYGPRLALTDLASGRQQVLPACGGAGLLVEAVAPHHRDGWWMLCSDGSLRLINGDGERTVAQTPLRAPLANATALQVNEAGIAWIGSSKGHVLRVDAAAASPPSTAPLADLNDPTLRAAAEAGLARPMSSLIRELEPVGPWLAVRGDRGEVRLVDPQSLKVVAQLPGSAHGNLVAVALGKSDQLVSGGPAVQRWQVPALGAPSLLEVAERRSVTGVCRLRDGVVVGQGPGDVEKFDALTHAPLWRSRWQSGVIKAVACDRERDTVWAVGMTDHAVVQLSGRDGRRLGQSPLAAPARRLLAREGGWLAASFVGGLWSGGAPGAAGSAPDAPQLLGEANADWTDLDGGDTGANATACAVEGRSGEVAAIRGKTLQRLAILPGTRTCAIPRDGGVVIASDERVQWLRPSGPVWTQPLAARPADLAVDGDIAAVALLDGSTQVLRLSDGQLVAHLSGHGERVAALLFDPFEPAILWTASWDGSLRRWHGSAWREPAQKLVDAANLRWGSQAETR